MMITQMFGQRYLVLMLFWPAVWFAVTADGQVTAVNSRIVRPKLTLGDTMTVSASPSTVSFSLMHGGVANGSGTVAMTTTWTGISLLASMSLYGYFMSSTQALSGGSPVAHIPSSSVLGKVPSGTPTSYTAFTQSGPLGGAGAGLLMYSQSSILSLGGSRTDNLSLQIDLTSLPQQPAASYSGTLVLQAQAF